MRQDFTVRCPCFHQPALTSFPENGFIYSTGFQKQRAAGRNINKECQSQCCFIHVVTAWNTHTHKCVIRVSVHQIHLAWQWSTQGYHGEHIPARRNLKTSWLSSKLLNHTATHEPNLRLMTIAKSEVHFSNLVSNY